MIFPTHRQAPLSPSAVKASAGAVEHLLLVAGRRPAGRPRPICARAGLRVVGAEAGAPLTAREADLRGPLAIVVGSEGQGLSPAVRRRCDFVVRIPMRGAIGSLNAAVAGSILLFEAVAQRDPDGNGCRAAARARRPDRPRRTRPATAGVAEREPSATAEPSAPTSRRPNAAPPRTEAADDEVAASRRPGARCAAAASDRRAAAPGRARRPRDPSHA